MAKPQVKIGNLLNSEAQTLVNTVNCVGVMGKGIALEFKKQFPAMFDDYARRCAKGQVKLGEPYMFTQMFGPNIINFPTKDDWRSLAKLSDIVDGLLYLETHYKAWGIESIAVPPLGCGNGQLEWRVVGRTLYRHLCRLDIPIELYAPLNTPNAELTPEFLSGEYQPTDGNADGEWMKPGWVAVLEVIKRLDDQPYHWPIGRTVFQKILFVATLLGIPTGLEFARASYGPYTVGEKKLESRLVNHGLINVERVGSRQQFSIGRTYGDAIRSYGDEIQQWDVEIDRVVDLFTRVRTANEAELVAAILYCATEQKSQGDLVTEQSVYDAVMEWKKRRRPPLEPVEVGETVRVLASQGWIDVEASENLPIEDWALAL